MDTMTDFEREQRSGPIVATVLLLSALASVVAWVGLAVWL